MLLHFLICNILQKFNFSNFKHCFSIISIFQHQNSILFGVEKLTSNVLIDFKIFEQFQFRLYFIIFEKSELCAFGIFVSSRILLLQNVSFLTPLYLRLSNIFRNFTFRTEKTRTSLSSKGASQLKKASVLHLRAQTESSMSHCP